MRKGRFELGLGIVRKMSAVSPKDKWPGVDAVRGTCERWGAENEVSCLEANRGFLEGREQILPEYKPF